MDGEGPAPLIVTLRFDEASFEVLDGARRRHFPPACNHIPAHLTLFHHLPGEDEDEIARTLGEIASATPVLGLAVSGLRFLGYGSAFTIDSPPLLALRQALAALWHRRLTPQDASPFKPHVTIQNKVPAAEAKHLFSQLQETFCPFEAAGTGLLLWRYRGGPWDAAGEFAFEGTTSER